MSHGSIQVTHLGLPAEDLLRFELLLVDPVVGERFWKAGSDVAKFPHTILLLMFLYPFGYDSILLYFFYTR